MTDLERAEQFVDTELESCVAFAHGDPQGMWRRRLVALFATKRVCEYVRNHMPLAAMFRPPSEYEPRPVPAMFWEAYQRASPEHVTL